MVGHEATKPRPSYVVPGIASLFVPLSLLDLPLAKTTTGQLTRGSATGSPWVYSFYSPVHWDWKEPTSDLKLTFQQPKRSF